ncbi:MAG: bifunctional molybdenum cofactor biosynthesis protein MoaC/MoaB [Algoriphagus sp.]|jgi:molybdenum cofactor biosynthesis protein MoaC|uniref:bifunctional molybdenum cofactor biosynthesis protein MoaC/MoaB n=1 Tax=Algoriphagus sp. TaxID=1872435 RepID=UPI00272F9B81|nr:bifunctional molybdenum cofactor biosynthesis protein MoaC/MoaB [Algoriphagus sp.]MDP2043290.1 bifunctional molybdenum cofactor biosynthesis protein MoaC/MoaB [Algoriphagus sp.]MDP3472422.1 bifunctional molybdenum cofactor biosynthesis protein MoaC/MoaB [Algoriphagus sp.]
MVNITNKSTTLRKAIAQAIVKVSLPGTIQAIHNHTVPKGNVLECARVAGLFAAKRTADMIPDCHPLPVEFTAISYEVGVMEVTVFVEIHTIYKTGVEVEAMHAASVVALTIYDMLKPIDKKISIEQIKLVEKKGGKSDRKKDLDQSLRAAVIVCSDSISAGKKGDRAGMVVKEKLEKVGVHVPVYRIIPDEKDQIRQLCAQFVGEKMDLVIFTGGTGLSPRDVTPEALEGILERRIPGIEEAIRNYGQQRTPYSMLSRSVAGLIGDTLVLGLPGSTNGASESMDAVFPALLHIFKVMEGARHD